MAAATAVTAWLADPVAQSVFLFDHAPLPDGFFAGGQGWWVYGLGAVFTASAVTMWLAPGVLIALATCRETVPSWSVLIARGFLYGYGVRWVAHALPKLAPDGALTAGWFWGSEIVFMAVAVAALLGRLRRGGLPLPDGPLRRLALVPLLPAVCVLAIAPAIFWQDFSEDGLEALEIGWSLTHSLLPRFPNETGYQGLGIGMLSMAAPVSWFVQLLGPTELAARLPLGLYLPVLAFVLIGLIEHGRRRLDTAGLAMVLLVLAAFVAAMAFSASYSPYGADVAAPTAFESLTVTCLAGAVLGLWRGERGMFLCFVALAYLARPTGLMLVLLLALVTAVVVRGEQRRAMLVDVGLAFGLCVAILIVYEKLFVTWIAGGEVSYGSGSIIDRFRYVRFADLRRLGWVMIPGGFLPFLSLFLYRRQDPLTRQLAGVIVLYFVFFLPPAFVALHHFVPVMVLPVVVYLRTLDGVWVRRAGAFGCALGLVLALPHHLEIDRAERGLARRMVFEIGQYGGAPDAHRLALDTRNAVFVLFPVGWDVADLRTERVGLPHSLLHYSTQYGVTEDEADYVIRSVADPAPPGFVEVGRREGAVAYARDLEVLEIDRASVPGTTFGNPLLVIPRETLFNFIGIPAGAYDFDMGSLPFVWRVFARE